MNAVGIDVSKGKSMVAAIRPFGEVVLSPFEVSHTGSELGELARTLKSLPGETRVVMEYTGYYHAPVAQILCDAGIYVSVVNPLLVHDYGNNSLRRVKTDKKDAFKLASYALEHWLSLPQYYLVGDTRLMLKTAHRQYEQMVNMRSRRTTLSLFLTPYFQTLTGCFLALRGTTAARSGWISYRASGIANALATSLSCKLLVLPLQR